MDVSLSIAPGQTVALVGPSGGGKTTLANLISRYFDPQAGRISNGGVECTILENIRIGRKVAADADVIAAGRLANCEELVQRLPEEWNSPIGQNGCELSGGER